MSKGEDEFNYIESKKRGDEILLKAKQGKLKRLWNDGQTTRKQNTKMARVRNK